MREVHGVSPSRIAAVFNPLDVARWAPVDRAAARAEVGLPPHARVVAWHDRVEVGSKGVDVLVEAWRRLRAARPELDTWLALTGTGPDAPELRRLLVDASPDRVRWTERYVLDRGAIRRFLGAADIYAFPSRREGFPVAPVEAMASSLPVVAAAAPGVAHIFAGGTADGGLVVPTGDAPAFADALITLVDDDEQARQLGRRGGRGSRTRSRWRL